MRKLFIVLALMLSVQMSAQRVEQPVWKERWITTWATAQQTPVKSFMPYNNEMTFRSVRQIVKVSVGGRMVRLELSNELSSEPVEIRSVYIANATEGWQIEPHSARYLTFHGRERVVIEPGKAVVSDAEPFELKHLQLLAVTINYKRAPKEPTVHMGSRTTSYILKGYSNPETSFANAFRYEKWFNIAALDVAGGQEPGIAIIGNSITDGKGSTTDKQNRWPDEMSLYLNSERSPLQHSFKEVPHCAILNLGIGNNRVLTVGFGKPARERFDRDVLAQRGVKAVIVFEGINDLGTSREPLTTARRLIEAYKEMADKAHRRGLRAYIATITPCKGSGYFSVGREAARQLVNAWIRNNKEYDGVIDFDELMRAPADKVQLRPEWQSDWLHPNPEGYVVMGRFAAEFIIRQIDSRRF
ncbi:MAG: SGNH/GDSL hydrolase family protein [Prevotella sp.]|nr:SGNH/GDSL hydrolase family protein [Prevotella sp.]